MQETEWKQNLLSDDDAIRDLLISTKSIAVLGIKPETHSNQPAFYVPKYLCDAGFEIIPVPVYYPEVTEIFGKKVIRHLHDLPAGIDLVNIFRRSRDINIHTEDLLHLKPKAVWFQLGIRNDRVAESLAMAGIKVVQDLCIMVEHSTLLRGSSGAFRSS
ncbi:MAG: CoA-binding protein [Pyrinomonadaceae bacterium]